MPLTYLEGLLEQVTGPHPRTDWVHRPGVQPACLPPPFFPIPCPSLPPSFSSFPPLPPFFLPSSPPSLAYHLCVCESLCLCSVCILCGVMVHMWGSENWQESVLSFHCVHTGNGTQVALPAKPFYWPERICSRCWGRCCWPSTTSQDHRDKSRSALLAVNKHCGRRFRRSWEDGVFKSRSSKELDVWGGL